MYRYSAHSRAQRATLNRHLQEILDGVLVTDDFRIDLGERARADQQREFEEGDSTIPGYNPDGSPNEYPHMPRDEGCQAADLWPYINGRRLAVPTYREIQRRVQAGDADHYIADAVARYAQFTWFLRRVHEVATRHFEAVRLQTGEVWEFRMGINWDRDAEILTDHNFRDYPHIEIRRVA